MKFGSTEISYSRYITPAIEPAHDDTSINDDVGYETPPHQQLLPQFHTISQTKPLSEPTLPKLNAAWALACILFGRGILWQTTYLG